MKVVGRHVGSHIPYEEHRAATHIVLQLNTDEGARGISYLTPLVPWAVAPIRATIDALMERVHGANPMAVESINAALLARAVRPQFDGLARSAVSVIDIALWDLKAKALSQPLFRLLGGSTDRVSTYAAWDLFHSPRLTSRRWPERPRACGPWLPWNESPRGLLPTMAEVWRERVRCAKRSAAISSCTWT
jgi:L-alanine-DL-glutamate epimerase-like enolase superfamily enzyme